MLFIIYFQNGQERSQPNLTRPCYDLQCKIACSTIQLLNPPILPPLLVITIIFVAC